MKRWIILVLGLGIGLAAVFSSSQHARGEEFNANAKVKLRVLGEGPAYEQVGKLAVMHVGRVKPLDTVAREEIKHVFGRETIKLHDAAGEVVETWGPVGAFLDWMVRPEFWDDQSFILVDYLPLRHVILAGSVRQQLKDIAARSATSAEDRASLTSLAKAPELSTPTVSSYLGGSKLPEADRKAVAELAAKLG